MSRGRGISLWLTVLVISMLTQSVNTRGAAAAAAPATTCPDAAFPHSTDPEQPISAGRRPIVLVHGWTGDAGVWTGGGSNSAVRQLTSLFPTGAFYEFDYRDNNTTWPATPEIAGCLSLYINTIGAAYAAAGGDGKVLGVGHSMGGLALLYSTSDADAGIASTAHLGGIVSLDTPFLGSPFGGTEIANVVQSTHDAVPAIGSNAQQCLSLHTKGGAIPGCSWDYAPVLPSSVPLTSVAGEVTLQRKLFGFNVYSVPLASDGIVSVASQTGYASMFAEPPVDGGHIDPDHEVACDVDFELSTALARAKQYGVVIDAVVMGSDLLASDKLFDFLKGGYGAVNTAQGTALTAAMLDGLTASCSHTNIVRNPTALSAVAKALSGYDTAARARAAGQAAGAAGSASWHSLPASSWQVFGGTSRDVGSGLGPGNFTLTPSQVFWGGATADLPTNSCDYAVRAQARALQEGGGYGVGVWGSVSGGTPSGQEVQYDLGAGGYMDASMPGNTETAPVKSADLNLGWHTVEFSMLAGQYTATVDGTTVFTGRSRLPCSPTAILRVWRGGAEFRSVEWQANSGPAGN